MHNPSISVVIPCYNAAQFLGETLDSVLGQTYTPLEVIVVDDGSTDDSAAIAESYGPPVRVICQENQGESVARNRGIQEARGDWIAFLDADDVWMPTKLERQTEMIEPGVVCVYTGHFFFGLRNYVPKKNGIFPDGRYRIEHVASQNPFNMSVVVARRTSEARFPTWTQHGEDRLYMLDLIQEGSIRFIEEPLAGVRCHTGNQSRDDRIEIRRHQSLLNWLERRAATLTTETVRLTLDLSIERLSSRALGARSRRDWKTYWELRNYLAEFPENGQARRITTERIYPRWVYAAKDAIDNTFRLLRLRRPRVIGNPSYEVSNDGEHRVERVS